MQAILSKAIYALFSTLVIFALILSFQHAPFFLSNDVNAPIVSKDILYAGTFACLVVLIVVVRKFSYFLIPLPASKALLLLFSAAVLPRLAWILGIHIVPVSDFHSYHIFAAAMAQGNIIGEGYISIFPSYFAFPAILSLLYMIFGAQVIVAQCFNVLLSGFIAMLLYSICRLAFRKHEAGFYAGLFWAFWPSQIFYTALICTEYIFVCNMLLGLWVFLKIRAGNLQGLHLLGAYAGLGLFMAFINALRPLGLILLTALVLYLILEKSTEKKYTGFLHSKPMLLTVVLLLYFIGTQAITLLSSGIIKKEIARKPYGFNLFVGLNLSSNGTWSPEDAAQIENVMQKLKTTDAQTLHDAFMQMALSRFSDMSATQMQTLLIEKFKVLWMTDSEISHYLRMGLDPKHPAAFDFYRFENLLIKLCNFYYYGALMLALSGVFFAVTRPDNHFVLYCSLVVLGLATLHLAVEAAGRYRFPSIVFFAMMAGFALSHWSGLPSSLKSKDSPSLQR